MDAYYGIRKREGDGAGEEVEAVSDPPPAPIVVEDSLPMPATEGGNLDPIAKKICNLNKKKDLKKTQRGERLEATQLKKMDTEAEIRKELTQWVA
ncbi:hypothetical protein BU17DRAFT_98581 [Hysterangium stoloniferum]|nr:hypothetical protein BU17DRAFT_98581 [Hysterangium stoloniferum]